MFCFRSGLKRGSSVCRKVPTAKLLADSKGCCTEGREIYSSTLKSMRLFSLLLPPSLPFRGMCRGKHAVSRYQCVNCRRLCLTVYVLCGTRAHQKSARSRYREAVVVQLLMLRQLFIQLFEHTYVRSGFEIVYRENAGFSSPWSVLNC